MAWIIFLLDSKALNKGGNFYNAIPFKTEFSEREF